MASLALSASFSLDKNPLNSAVLPGQAYVLSLVALDSHYAASASEPSNSIHLLDKGDLSKNVQTLRGHQTAVTGLRCTQSLAGTHNVLLSCGKDGFVRAWDERSGSISIEMAPARGRRALLSCDVSPDGLTVAAGSILEGDDAVILYWDPRNPIAPLRTHASTHSDDITVVRFSRTRSTQNVLLSASSDGLVSTSNPDEDDEDEAGLHVGNWGCSISNVGWIDTDCDNGPRVWASSDMETLSLWSSELDVMQDFDRSRFTLPDPNFTWVTDYVIDCQSSGESFRLFAGSNEGDIAVLSPSGSLGQSGPWNMDRVLATKHEGVVRCVLWDEANGVLLTGGEDSRINAWGLATISDVHPEGMDVDSTPRKRTYDERSDFENRGFKKFRPV